MITIGDKQLDIPIIQGGMGVGISLGNLAGHVALEGGMGVISTAHPGYRAKDFNKNPLVANLRELAVEITKAKEIAGKKGMVAVNVMVAIREYANMVEESIKAGVDAIISGAGLPLNLPKYVENTKTKIAPIVSSAKAANVILRTWDRKYQKTADFIVIEGSEAGGHLGFKKEDILENKTQNLTDILKEVLEVVKPYIEKYKQDIPIFVGGGVYTGQDIKAYRDLGASGVQMATRFITTKECDASEEYKEMFVKAQKEDIELVKSPVGMPGRAIISPLTKTLSTGERIPVKRCVNCLIPCDPKTTQYCITHALIEAAKGNVEEGLFFSGTNGYRNNQITTVKEVIQQIMEEYAV